MQGDPVPFNLHYDNGATKIRTNGYITYNFINLENVENTYKEYIHFVVYGIN